MERIGLYDAKARLSEIVERVESGSEVVITRRGKAVARIVPMKVQGKDRRSDAAKRIRELREKWAIGAVADFDIVTERDTAGPAALAALARRYALTAYDATYLHLALRLKLPLACKDTSLRSAATRAGVNLA